MLPYIQTGSGNKDVYVIKTPQTQDQQLEQSTTTRNPHLKILKWPSKTSFLPAIRLSKPGSTTHLIKKL